MEFPPSGDGAMRYMASGWWGEGGSLSGLGGTYFNVVAEVCGG